MTTSSLPTEIQGVLDRFDQALTRIEERVQPFVEKPRKDVAQDLSATENAKLNLVYGYSLNSLFYMYLKTQGVSPKEHPVRRELDRVKRYMGKTMQMEERAKKQKQREEEAALADQNGDGNATEASSTPKSKEADARGSKRKTPEAADRNNVTSTPKSKTQGKPNNNKNKSSAKKKQSAKRKR
mmetsp:Transcript_11239/g.21944  ORF Transcript_11239/g.21944 Transcript_11239/m.21944 type:complete len:183 (-) Transcript_11239:1433-1981(-)|eukprot:CAMPEP_0171496604 /NCGR_PEP_ID=MMETSP0958-20121227/6799_1 /TAXON_ID=87120 /ORGANISM="Aurantiochytrium limacinum, Strain ATCCMYA-1381" /LENGTH=182 /DNA_ID=CAMNT_0012030735 /DNA_START=67 /DNA_END=615 /DNA_ORIENTATION=-